MTSSLLEVERLIKDCTGEYVVAPDWNSFARLWDIINANPGRIKHILKPLLKRLTKKDPNTLWLSLLLLESVAKNCPCSYLFVGSSDVQNAVVKIALNKKLDLKISNKAIDMIQVWNRVFAEFDKSRFLFWKSYSTLLKKNVVFPPFDESQMFVAVNPDDEARQRAQQVRLDEKG